MSKPAYDYVVVGAGSAGCAVAARLSEDEARSVLLIEAGGSNRRLAVRAPAGFPNLFHGSRDWDYLTEPEPALDGRRIFQPRGRMLGGTSSMNAMIYVRGNRLDYESWVRDGAEGWSYEEVLPFYKRAERNEQISDSFHGVDGPLNVTRIDADPASLAMVEAATATGIPRNDDFNGERQDGAGQPQVTQRKGRRWSCAEAYLRPARRRRNLTVRKKAQATRVLLEGDRAVGVELGVGSRAERITAREEVVLCGGAFNTPALLQHSGIGDAEHLRRVGVEPRHDLPAVGQGLMEHPLVYGIWELAPGNVGLFDAEKPRYLMQWLARGSGKLASNVAECAAHVRTDPGLLAPDFQIIFAPAYFFDHGQVEWDSPAMTMGLSYIAPQSRGSVLIPSDDPREPPKVQLNMLSTADEMAAMVRAVELAREIAATAPGQATLGKELHPGPEATGDEQITAWIRKTAQHTYHPSCSVRMGWPDEAALDPQLRVLGIEGLRVADTSAMPTIIRGNTHAPAVMIGERCADFIRYGDRAGVRAPDTTSAPSA